MSNQQPLRIMVMAGGTGGHVFPALAVADELRARGVEVSWLGTRQGLEAEVVPRAGFPIDYVQVSGLRGKGVLSLLMAPVKLLLALSQSLKIIARRQPAAVLGMGGFVTGPGGLAAWLKRRPLLIHEQNARAGLTNRLLAPLARRVMEAFPGTFAVAKNALHTGNPLRKTFIDAVPDKTTLNTENHALRLLVVGGSSMKWCRRRWQHWTLPPVPKSGIRRANETLTMHVLPMQQRVLMRDWNRLLMTWPLLMPGLMWCCVVLVP